jgi:putative hemolysin
MSMQNGAFARSTQRLIEMLRPEKIGTAAQTAMTWFKPQPSPSGVIRPIRLPAFPATLGRLGALEVRLAQGNRDVKRAQKLRYRVFYKDGTAIADAATLLARRDKDAFDKICDHLLVIDHAAKPTMGGKQPVVGTYRLLRQDVAKHHGGFYTEDEFDISGPDRSSCGFTFSRARTILRAAALSQQTHRRIAVARHLELCSPTPARRDDRLRQLRGH